MCCPITCIQLTSKSSSDNSGDGEPCGDNEPSTDNNKPYDDDDKPSDVAGSFSNYGSAGDDKPSSSEEESGDKPSNEDNFYEQTSPLTQCDDQPGDQQSADGK